jgi:hypothetical protein
MYSTKNHNGNGNKGNNWNQPSQWHQQADELFAPQPRAPQEGQFQSLFEVAAARLGMGREFKAIKVCHDAGKILDTLLPGFAGQYKVASFRDGVLTVASDNPALLQKIQMSAHHLLQDLNKGKNGLPVTKVKTRTGLSRFS